VERLRDAVPARTVTLRLDPPEMGTIDVTVRARGRSVDTTLVTQHDWVRQVVEMNKPQLESQLNQRGLDLGAFDVSSQARAHDQGANRPQSDSGLAVSSLRLEADGMSENEPIRPATTSLYSRHVDLEA
jgi:flagellar hook-length control protein FliK